ncbi:MAG: prenyltransferase/squalene oxidase repeat-containing protein [Candidatus Bathyarchaeia archaeon]
MEKVLNQLEVDPLNYAANLESPIGVYLRRDVFRKENKADIALKNELYKSIIANQAADGSWDQLFVSTANNLWNLALLGYDARDKSVKKGLEWLLSIQRHQYRGYPGFFHSNNRKDPSTMRSTFYGEFGPGCTIFYQTTYAVHLFCLFGFDENKRVRRTVESYLRFWRPDWCGSWCTINVLRMLIEHPLSRESKQVESGLKYLAERQTRTGAWKGFPFYHTFHALSRTQHTSAKKQLEKAGPSVVKRQNRDGSWGRREPETETFLVLDALKNIRALVA